MGVGNVRDWVIKLGKDEEGEQLKQYLNRGGHCGVREKPGARKAPGNPQG